MKDYKEFKSIHVDLEKGIYLLNGEPMKHVTELNLMLDGERWSLRINKYEWFKEGSRRSPGSISRAIRDTGASIRAEMKEAIKNVSTKELVNELIKRERALK
jgi:hypothetical protein|nr:MAG TPA: hypothetical protein [Caudoviricetes sp.]